MQELHIYDGIHAQFANIDRECLLGADFSSFPLLIRDFLPTLSEVNHEGHFAFRILAPLIMFTWTSYVVSFIPPPPT